MDRFPARRAPLWFVVLLAVCIAAAARSVWPALVNPGGAGAHEPAPQLAFWFWLVVLAETVWKGVEVAGKVALAILQYSVHILWRFAILIAKGAREIGVYTWRGLRKAWELLRLTYSHVLKPAWKFVWKWVDKTERWLQRTFEPLMRWLRKAQKWIRDFYTNYLRPVLDIIDVTRRSLRVLASLGVGWARTLDAKLGTIEDLIQRNYLRVVGELNKVINIVNRVVTADGLFQRLAFIRTLGRDYKQAWHALTAPYMKQPTDAQKNETRDKSAGKPLEQVTSDVRAYMQTKSGGDASLFNEMAAQWRKQLRTR
jgi:hypothetical protein